VITFTPTVRATVVALAIAATAAPAALAHGHLASAHHVEATGQAGTALIVPTTSTEHSSAASLTDPLLVPTNSTEHVAGTPATVIIRSAPAGGFDWAAAIVGALAATAAALLAYGAATVLRSRSGELVNN
jgi:hypothetical protein